MTLLLLITLCACTTKTITKIKYLTIPDKYLVCMGFSNVDISMESISEAKKGNYKLLSIEQAKIYTDAKRFHDNQCVRNAESAREYQKRMSEDV